jgi:hypothetical protein
MPILDVQFENGIFFAREVDYITEDDAHNWARALGHYAAASSKPIVALIDAREVTAISNDARRVFAMASETSNVAVAAVVVNQVNRLATQQSRITALLSAVRKTHDTYFFESLAEAEEFAGQYIQSPARTS